MIAADQFTNLPEGLVVITSSREDGSVLDRTLEVHDSDMVKNRQSICRSAGIEYQDVVYQRIVYGDQATYDVIAEVDVHSTTRFTPEIVADALFTTQLEVGMFLPVADCIVTIIYDPQKRYLAQLHMGRHSTLTDLLPKMVQKFTSEGSDPADLQVWMGPAATRASYRLDFFDHEHDPAWRDFFDKKPDGYYLDMQGFNRQRCLDVGIRSEHITISPIDSAIDQNYFSHSRGDTTKRFAGVAMMR